MERTKLPTKSAIGRIAENQPGLLNILLAYFVFEWREVRLGNPAHGIDQTGMTCIVPDYVETWPGGVNEAVHLLLRCPAERGAGEPGYVSEWLARISAVPR